MLGQGSRSHWFHRSGRKLHQTSMIFAKKPPLSAGILPLKHGTLMAGAFPAFPIDDTFAKICASGEAASRCGGAFWRIWGVVSNENQMEIMFASD